MKLLKNWDENKFKISKYKMGRQMPKSRGKNQHEKDKDHKIQETRRCKD